MIWIMLRYNRDRLQDSKVDWLELLSQPKEHRDRLDSGVVLERSGDEPRK
jgi:hypothetical protein